jgi:MFS family permease
VRYYAAALMSILSKDRIVAEPGFNRWWNIPAALLINMSIGQAYAFSVFNIPLSRIIGVTESAPDDWELTTLGWVFTLAYVFLGLSAGLGGQWQERVGPRMSGFVAALCFGGGFFIAALGVFLHEIWLLYVGYGIIGGTGLGLGFTTPIATLIRWFPDHRGLATGLGVMGFGGGAIVAAPVSTALMERFASPSSVGVWETFAVMGSVYLVAMIAGAFLFRIPPDHVTEAETDQLERARGTSVRDAMRTRQFFLLWTIMVLNVTAGIGVLGQASPMIQEVFTGFSAAAAAAFVALLSFFNMGGRLMWSSLSDQIGRKATFALFFTVGPLLYALVPFAGHLSNIVMFVTCFALILTMYGGGFACIPAYVADVFGTRDVGPITGRVLTALSVAGVLGPVLVNYIREYQIDHGVTTGQAYDITMFIMAGLLIVGFFCNRAIHPVALTEPVGSSESQPAA